MVVSVVSAEFIRAFGLILISIVIAKLFVYFLSNYALVFVKKSKTSLDDKIIEAIKKPIFYFIILIGTDFALSEISTVPALINPLQSFIFAAEVLLGAFFISRIVSVFGEWYANNITARTKSRFDDEFLPLFNRIAKLFIYGSAIVIILDFFEYEITAIVAGLGIAGLAFALAAQDTLANMISGFVIMADRPFRIKDIIQLPGGEYGEVHEIGLRSTKILTLDALMVVIPNSQIGNSQIINYSYPDNKIRLKIPVGVAYGSNPKEVAKIVKDVARKQPKVLQRPAPRCRLSSFGDFSLNLTLYVWVDSHRDRVEVIDKINMEIFDRFKKEGIEIPFPTRNILIKKEE
jgi:small-conductance mechanosensitive channel